MGGNDLLALLLMYFQMGATNFVEANEAMDVISFEGVATAECWLWGRRAFGLRV